MSTKVTTATPVRLSYTYLTEAHAQNDGDDPKFSTAILIPKGDTETIKAIKAAINEALADGIAKKWKGKKPQNLHNPLRDGDTKEDKDGNADELYAGHWFLNAKGPRGGQEAPILLDKDNEKTNSSAVVYSGVFGRVSLQFYPYENSGNKGVACGLTAFLSEERGEPLGNTVTVESALSEFGVAPSGKASKAAAEFAGGESDEGKPAPSDTASGEDDPWGE